MKTTIENSVIRISCSLPEMVEYWKFPYFGYSIPSTKTLYIRDDLPPRVLISVLAHETQHISDNAFSDGRVWYWESRAWWAGFRADWRGFLQGIWMSLTDRSRVRLYLSRVLGNF